MAGAARTERRAEELSLIANPMLATGRDQVVAHAQREEQREMMAILLSTPPYWPSLDLYGWRDRGERLNGMVREERWKEMSAVLSDEMMEVFVPCAPYAKLAEVLVDQYAELADGLCLALPNDSEDDAAMARLVAELRGD